MQDKQAPMIVTEERSDRLIVRFPGLIVRFPCGHTRSARRPRHHRLLLQQVALEARLQFAECGYVRTPLLIRNAPTADPLDQPNSTAFSAGNRPPNAPYCNLRTHAQVALPTLSLPRIL